MTRNRLQTIASLVGFAIGTTSCAYGQKHPYHLAHPFVDQGRSISIALAAQDQRYSVTTGGRPDFVGLSRAGFGNSYDVTTASGQPLATDFVVSIRRGLEAAGYRVTPVSVMNRARLETVSSALAKTGADRLLAVQIQEWQYDAYLKGRLNYNVTMRVFDPRGQELGRAVVSGSDVLGGDPPAKVPTKYLEKLEELLNDPAIKRGLASSSAVPSAPAMPVAPAPDQTPPPASEPAVVVPAP